MLAVEFLEQEGFDRTEVEVIARHGVLDNMSTGVAQRTTSSTMVSS